MTERTAQLAHNWIKDADALLITASNVLRPKSICQ